jgi:pimeloyl-ACP methyl ester carboxylesterase
VHSMSRLVAFCLLGAVVCLVGLGVLAPWSASGWFTLGAATVAGLSLLAKERGVRRGLGLVALLLLAILLGVRIVGGGDGLITMITLPSGKSSRWLGRLVDEQDVAQAGAQVVARMGRLPAEERKQLVPTMHDAYLAMRRDDAFSPSPVLDTLLGRQAADASDALVIEARAEPEKAAAAQSGVIFLHGYAGSFTLECWLMAGAARAIGAVTVCPATGFSGYWHDESGRRIVQAALDYLHGRGIKHVVLAGLSNGAMGASALVSHFAPALDGLVLISGAPQSGSDGGLPTLVVHGRHDGVTSVEAAHAFATRTHATYAELDGGHFVLMVKRSEARQIVADWLEKRWAAWRAKERTR